MGNSSYRIRIVLVSCFLMLIMMSTSGVLFPATAEDVEIIGTFYDDDIYLTIGDITVVEGEVMSAGSNLNRITYQIDGWAGEDENNRYCSQAVEGLDLVRLDEMQDLILDATCAPLNQPGMYTLWLVASTESGNWGKLDCLNVYVEAAYTEEYVDSDIPEYSWEEALPEPVAVETYEEYVIENNPRPEMVEPIVTEAPAAELMGYFSYDNITLTVGDVTTVAGEVGSKNYNLAQITYQIEGWAGIDDNNRYCTQAVSGTNYVNLSEMGELVLNTNTAPLNQPGSYTLKLVARAEDGTWAQLSTMQVNVQAPASPGHSEPEVTAAPSYSEKVEQEEITVDATVAPILGEEIYIEPQPVAELMGYFSEDSLTLTIGDVTTVAGEVGSKNYNLAQITYQIEGWAGVDDNNRYCTQAVSGTNYINLSEMGELVLNTNTAPLNQPGSYTLKLVARAEDGTWAQLSTMQVNVQAPASPGHSEPEVTAAPFHSEEVEQEEFITIYPVVTEVPAAELMGYFANESITLEIGEATTIEGEVGSKNYNLAQITYQIEGWAGTDDNNRYCTQAVSGTNYVNLAQMNELVLNTNTAPLNQPGSYTLKLVARAEDGTWAQLDNMKIEICAAPENTVPSIPQGGSCVHSDIEVYDDYDTIGSFSAVDNSYHSYSLYVTSRNIYCNDCNTIVESIAINETINKQGYHYFWPDGSGNMVCMDCGHRWNCSHSNSYVIDNKSEEDYEYLDSQRHVYSRWVYEEMYPEDGMTYHYCPDCGEYGEGYSDGYIGWGISDLPMNEAQKVSTVEAHTFENGVCIDCGCTSEGRENSNQGTKPDPTEVPQIKAELKGYFADDSITLKIGEVKTVAGEVGSRNHNLVQITYQIEGWAGADDNNRYCTQAVSGTNYVNLSELGELVLNTNTAPLNQPGSYTLKLVARAEDGTWGQLDSMQVNVLAVEIEEPEMPAAELMGYFTDDNITLKVGEVTTVEGEVGSKNYNLAQITYQIDGWSGIDENNRYCTQAVSGTNYVNLAQMNELVLNTNAAPLNQPGSYTLKLVARAEDGTWDELDNMRITVEGQPIDASKDIVEVARSQIGYVETGTNKTKYGVFTKSDGYSWCAPFVAWCANEAGVAAVSNTHTYAHPGKQCLDGQIFSIYTEADWEYQAHKSCCFANAAIVKRSEFVPQHGDLIYFLWPDDKGTYSFSHVGIVDYVSNGYVYYIDGNGGSGTEVVDDGGSGRKSDLVALRKKLLTSSHIVAYARPDYTGQSSEKIENSPAVQTELQGYFLNDSIIMNVGERIHLEGEVGSKGTTLVQITYQIDGWPGIDNNNRYCTQTIGQTNHVNLAEMNELTLDASIAPLNQPGNYTLRLVARAEDGTWAQLDSVQVKIQEVIGIKDAKDAANKSFANDADAVRAIQDLLIHQGDTITKDTTDYVIDELSEFNLGKAISQTFANPVEAASNLSSNLTEDGQEMLQDIIKSMLSTKIDDTTIDGGGITVSDLGLVATHAKYMLNNYALDNIKKLNLNEFSRVLETSAGAEFAGDYGFDAAAFVISCWDIHNATKAEQEQLAQLANNIAESTRYLESVINSTQDPVIKSACEKVLEDIKDAQNQCYDEAKKNGWFEFGKEGGNYALNLLLTVVESPIGMVTNTVNAFTKGENATYNTADDMITYVYVRNKVSAALRSELAMKNQGTYDFYKLFKEVELWGYDFTEEYYNNYLSSWKGHYAHMWGFGSYDHDAKIQEIAYDRASFKEECQSIELLWIDHYVNALR